MSKMPFPTIHRMSYLYDALDKLTLASVDKVTSEELGIYTGQTASTIRKDIHLLEYHGTTGMKYDVAELKKLLQTRLGFDKKLDACIVGLGNLGSALLDYLIIAPQRPYHIVAGFDSNVNRLETITTSVELFPAYRIEEIVRAKKIDLALITVPFSQAQEIADKCCDGGISGILNFSSLSLVAKRKGVFVRFCDIGCELNVLSALTSLK